MRACAVVVDWRLTTPLFEVERRMQEVDQSYVVKAAIRYVQRRRRPNLNVVCVQSRCVSRNCMENQHKHKASVNIRGNQTHLPFPLRKRLITRCLGARRLLNSPCSEYSRVLDFISSMKAPSPSMNRFSAVSSYLLLTANKSVTACH